MRLVNTNHSQIHTGKERKMFKKNEGIADRVIRIIIGAALLVIWFMYPDLSYRNWLLLGLIPLITGLVGWCAIYAILGKSTDTDKG